MIAKTPLEALTRAKALIENPKNWASSTREYHREHNRICAGIALDDVTERLSTVRDQARRLLCEAAGLPEGTILSIIEWNDSHTHAEVMEGFDKAIKLAKELI